jgi:hypothetical protein
MPHLPSKKYIKQTHNGEVVSDDSSVFRRDSYPKQLNGLLWNVMLGSRHQKHMGKFIFHIDLVIYQLYDSPYKHILH